MSGPRREQPPQLGAVRQARLIAAGGDRQRAARIAHPQGRLEVHAVEPPGDEPGAERIAGPDGIDRPSRRPSHRRGPASAPASTPIAPPVPSLATTVVRSERRDSRGQLGWIVIRVAVDEDRELVGAAEDDVHAGASARRIGAASASVQSRRRRLTSRLIVRPALPRHVSGPRRRRPERWPTGPA